MSKAKGGNFRGRDAKAGAPAQQPQVKRPQPPVPRVMPRTRASPKGR